MNMTMQSETSRSGIMYPLHYDALPVHYCNFKAPAQVDNVIHVGTASQWMARFTCGRALRWAICDTPGFTEPVTLDRLTPRERALMLAGFYNIMFINEHIDWIVTALVGFLRTHNLMTHDIQYWYGMFRDCKGTYMRRIANDLAGGYDGFCEQADCFDGLLRNDYDTFLAVTRDEMSRRLPGEQVDLFARLYVLGRAFTIARQYYYNWLTYYRTEAPAILTQPGFLNLDITPWVNKYNMMIDAICIRVNYKEDTVMETDQTDKAMEAYARKMCNTSTTLEALHSNDDSPHDMQLDIPLRPPHADVPARFLIDSNDNLPKL